MAELDRFEMRLEAAVHRYLEDAPVEADGATVARRVAGERPRRRLLPELRLLRPSPALAWLLLAALLAIAALGVLLAGARPDPVLPAVVPAVPVVAGCPPGSTPDQPGPADQSRPVPTGLRMAFDRALGRIVAIVPDETGAGWRTWTFDVCTNTWTGPAPGGAPSSPDADWPVPYPVHDAGAGLTVAIAVGGAPPLVFEPATNLWRAMGTPPDLGAAGPRLAYAPGSGSLYVQGITSGDGASPPPGDLWTYDVEDDSWEAVRQVGDLPPGISGDHLMLAFDTAAGRLVVVQGHANRPGTWLFDPRTGEWDGRRWSPAFNTGYVGSGGEIAYDERSRRTVVFTDGRVDAYDAVQDAWETLFEAPYAPGPLPAGPQARLGHWMAYDPLNGRLVVAGGAYRTAEWGWIRADDAWAFDTMTREWTQLVAPSRIERFDDATDTWVEVADGPASPTPAE